MTTDRNLRGVNEVEGREQSLTDAETREMRREVDRLRREVQELAQQVDDAARIDVIVGKAWRWVRSQFHTAPRNLKRRLLKRWRQGNAPSGPAPYDVRLLQPPRPARPRILHVIGNFHIGGSSQLVVDLIEHLGHLYEQHVVARDLPEQPAYRGLSLQRGGALKSRRQALRLLRSFAPDIVHIHYVGHRRDNYSMADWRWYRRVFDALEEYACPVIENVNIPVEPFYSPRVDCYVHVSDYVRDKFAFQDARNHTIHPGSDFQHFSRRTDAPVPNDHIGMIYRLDGDKVDERAIDVFIAVVQQRPQTCVSVVGGGQLLNSYRYAVERAGLEEAFSFPGYVPYAVLPEWLEKMSVFVAPVHSESFGQVSPFAMGMGLPVVGYNIGALEEITAAPELLAPPGDVAALARIITELLDDRERRLRIGRENKRRAETLFSVGTMIESYRGLYEQMVGG